MAGDIAKHDANHVPTLLGVSNADGTSTVTIYADPSTHRLLVTNSGSSGITSINTDATAAQTLTVGTTGTDFAIVDNGTGDHKFNLPDAGASARGVVTTGAQTLAGVKTFTQVLTTNNAITASGNAATVPVTSKINTVTNNSAATLTITMATASAIDGQLVIVRILDATGAAQTVAWVNTENSTVSAPTTSNGSTTLPLTVGFQFNGNTTLWRCIASA